MGKRGPKPKPPELHFKRIIVCLPPETAAMLGAVEVKQRSKLIDRLLRNHFARRDSRAV